MQQQAIRRQRKPQPDTYTVYVDGAPKPDKITAWTQHSARLQAKARYSGDVSVTKTA